MMNNIKLATLAIKSYFNLTYITSLDGILYSYMIVHFEKKKNIMCPVGHTYNVARQAIYRTIASWEKVQKRTKQS